MTTRNPSTVQAAKLGWKPDASGVFKITRHPVMWAGILWSVAHMLANGDLAAIILFGGIGVLSLLGALHLDRRKRAALGDEWIAFQAETSFIPPWAPSPPAARAWSAARFLVADARRHRAVYRHAVCPRPARARRLSAALF